MKSFKIISFILRRLTISFPLLMLSFSGSFAAGSKKMFSLENTDFVVLISFLIFLGVLIYYRVPSIVAALLDKRSNEIQTEIDNASEILEEAKKILSSIEADHIKTTETIDQMISNANARAREEEEKAKRNIEELMKNKLLSAEQQIKSNEQKILDEIQERAIDLSFEKVRIELYNSLSLSKYEQHFANSLESIEKGLKQVYN